MKRRGFMGALVALAALPVISQLGFAKDFVAKQEGVNVIGNLEFIGFLDIDKGDQPKEVSKGSLYKLTFDKTINPYRIITFNGSESDTTDVRIIADFTTVIFDGKQWQVLDEAKPRSAEELGIVDSDMCWAWMNDCNIAITMDENKRNHIFGYHPKSHYI
jgi:hypothetical protein